MTRQSVSSEYQIVQPSLPQALTLSTSKLGPVALSVENLIFTLKSPLQGMMYVLGAHSVFTISPVCLLGVCCQQFIVVRGWCDDHP